MGNFTRREFLVGTGLVFFSAAFPLLLRAQQLRTRYSVDSVAGAKMLEKYARAVAIMRDPKTPLTSPHSWTYQWYIHSIPNRIQDPMANKDNELARIFGSGPSPEKSLAAEVWVTCQAHRFGMDPHMFLPWHRMYLLAFEDIVRSVLNDQDFTLPYWDYTVSGKRSLPPQFLQKNNPMFGSLFVPNRKNDGSIDINAGDPMDKGATVSPYNLNAMSRGAYQGRLGFCQNLDGTLHGDVHTGVGDSSNMGSVPTAAGDPIFWLHHCMIDRIWAGWSAHGGLNPTTSAKFAFAGPAGARVEFDAAKMGDTVALRYQYDSLPAPPSGKVVASAAAVKSVRLAASAVAETTLGPGPTRVPLKPSVSGTTVSAAVSALPQTGRLFLSIDRLRTEVEPGVLYEAFVDLPANADLETRKKHYVGTFSFFGKRFEDRIDAGVSFDATAVFRALAADANPSQETIVTIIPVQAPVEGSKPRIGSIIVERQ
jgi:tyrosinase